MNDVTQQRLLETFVKLADTLIDDYDVVDLLQDLVETCRDVLDTTAAGILLADSRGRARAGRLDERGEPAGRDDAAECREGALHRELPLRATRVGARHRGFER